MLVEWKTISLLWPEVLLIAAASAIFVGGAFTKSRAWWALMALISYVAAGAALASFGAPWAADSVSAMSGPVTIDALEKEMIYDGLLNSRFVRDFVFPLDLANGELWAKRRATAAAPTE